MFDLKALLAQAKTKLMEMLTYEMEVKNPNASLRQASGLASGVMVPVDTSQLCVECSVKSQTPVVDPIKRLGNIIAKSEGNYESYNTGTKGVPGGRVGHSFVTNPPGTVTGKTINEILATEGLDGTDTGRMFATGKYQTIPGTLREAKSKLKLTGDEPYDEAMQERVFREYLVKAKRPTLYNFVVNGEGTVDDAQLAAAKEWASIGVPKGYKTGNGTISDGTMSYYGGPANKASKKTTEELRKFLEELQKPAAPAPTLNPH